MDELKAKIPSVAYEALIHENFMSLDSIIQMNEADLQRKLNLPDNITNEIVKSCVEIVLKNKQFTKASNLPLQKKLSTKCLNIDSLLKGGFPLSGINEIVGCSGVGKTQICLQLALTAQLPCEFGGTNKGVVYICTEDVFPSKRFQQLSTSFQQKYNMPDCDFSSNVFVEHIGDYPQLWKFISSKLQYLLTFKAIGLVVIDSIAGIFRGETVDLPYTNRSQQFVRFVHKLNKLAAKYEMGIVCVNQVTDNISLGTTEPCLGLSWSNLIRCRFNVVRNNHSTIREFEVVFSPDLPCGSCQFSINSDGIG